MHIHNSISREYTLYGIVHICLYDIKGGGHTAKACYRTVVVTPTSTAMTIYIHSTFSASSSSFFATLLRYQDNLGRNMITYGPRLLGELLKLVDNLFERLQFGSHFIGHIRAVSLRLCPPRTILCALVRGLPMLFL